MVKSFSPLRYPGGKAKIYQNVKNIILTNNFQNHIYVEPFAGGFSIGIGLLFENVVQSVVLNDYDKHIFNFWYAVINDTQRFIELVKETPITIEERDRQKKIYLSSNAEPLLDGFSTFFLNRVNFSGVIKGGPIGGISQSGTYKLNCRFNKKEIIRKIELIAEFRDKILLLNIDAGELIRDKLPTIMDPIFLNIDPPYVVKGSKLYTNFFTEIDHRNLKNVVSECIDNRVPWIITYDDCNLIREIYSEYYIQDYGIAHNAGGTKSGRELVITNISRDNFSW